MGFIRDTKPENFVFMRANSQSDMPFQSVDTEGTEIEPEDTEDLSVFIPKLRLCDLWSGLCALCDKD